MKPDWHALGDAPRCDDDASAAALPSSVREANKRARAASLDHLVHHQRREITAASPFTSSQRSTPGSHRASRTPARVYSPPRKGNIPQPNPMTVRFAPTVAGKFKSEFLFKVRKGQSVVLAVSGEATLQEEHHAIIAKERHLRMMHAGTLM